LEWDLKPTRKRTPDHIARAEQADSSRKPPMSNLLMAGSSYPHYGENTEKRAGGGLLKPKLAPVGSGIRIVRNGKTSKLSEKS